MMDISNETQEYLKFLGLMLFGCAAAYGYVITRFRDWFGADDHSRNVPYARMGLGFLVVFAAFATYVYFST